MSTTITMLPESSGAIENRMTMITKNGMYASRGYSTQAQFKCLSAHSFLGHIFETVITPSLKLKS
jgi:hypothetical protein